MEAIRKPEQVQVKIAPPNIREATFVIVGTEAYVQHKFSKKAIEQMKAKHEAGSQATKGKSRAKRDFQRDYEEATHFFPDGSCGIPASCFRAALISACRLVGFKMTLAKLSVFIVADGLDADGITPLVKIKGTRKPYGPLPARNDDGTMDLRIRPMWPAGWSVALKVRYDADQFSADDLANLLNRAGQQVGIGEGRPDSKNSPGLGFGLFTIQ